jgi:FixJ family two-component response regulator
MKSTEETVLIVDDEIDCRDECAQIVQQMGLRTCEAGNAREALAALEADPSISVVLTDVRMPGMDGITFIGEAHDRFHPARDLAFVVLTGHASLDIAVSALRFHAVDFLSKPVGRREIIEAVNRARESARRGRRGGDVELDSLAKQIDKVTKALESFSPHGNVDAEREPQRPAGSPIDGPFVRSMIRSRRVRDSFFAGELFADPAWDILLDLTASHLEGRLPSVSSLCLAAGVPPTTALRWIKIMTESGLLERIPDADDGRRILVGLTRQAYDQMVNCLRSVKDKMAIV